MSRAKQAHHFELIATAGDRQVAWTYRRASTANKNFAAVLATGCALHTNEVVSFVELHSDGFLVRCAEPRVDGGRR